MVRTRTQRLYVEFLDLLHGFEKNLIPSYAQDEDESVRHEAPSPQP